MKLYTGQLVDDAKAACSSCQANFDDIDSTYKTVVTVTSRWQGYVTDRRIETRSLTPQGSESTARSKSHRAVINQRKSTLHPGDAGRTR